MPKAEHSGNNWTYKIYIYIFSRIKKLKISCTFPFASSKGQPGAEPMWQNLAQMSSIGTLSSSSSDWAHWPGCGIHVALVAPSCGPKSHSWLLFRPLGPSSTCPAHLTPLGHHDQSNCHSVTSQQLLYPLPKPLPQLHSPWYHLL